MDRLCIRCGARLGKGDQFCTECGAAIPREAAPSEKKEKWTDNKKSIKKVTAEMKQAAAVSRRLIGDTALASSVGGEMVFAGAVSPAGESLVSTMGPVKYVFSGIKRILKGIKGAKKDKKTLLTVLALGVLWLILSLLPALGFNPFPVRLLSFLTFARGGIDGGLIGAVGGTIGKGLFAYFLTAFLLPAFSGKKSFAGLGHAAKRVLRSVSFKKKETLPPFLSGAGAALIFYNFLTGSASLQNSMVAIAALFLSLRALSGQAGFLRGFIQSTVNRSGRGKVLAAGETNRVIAGGAAGFALSVPLSASGIGMIGYLTGILILTVGLALHLLARRKEGAAVE